MTHRFQKGNTEIARIGGQASGQLASAKRLERWAAFGVAPNVGQKIYDAGYQACNQKWLRKIAAKDRPAPEASL